MKHSFLEDMAKPVQLIRDAAGAHPLALVYRPPVQDTVVLPSFPLSTCHASPLALTPRVEVQGDLLNGIPINGVRRSACKTFVDTRVQIYSASLFLALARVFY